MFITYSVIHTSWKTMIRSHHAISLKTILSPLATHNYDNKHCSLIDTFMGNITLKLDMLTCKSATRRPPPNPQPLRSLGITLIHIA